MSNPISNNSLDSSSISFPYHSLLFEIQQDQTNQNVASLNTYVQQSNPTFKFVEDEMMKIIRETYEQFPLQNLQKTPFEFLLSRLVELHLISRARYYHTLTQRVFLKVLSIVKHEFHKDFTEKAQAIGLEYWMKIDPFHLQTFLNTFQINDKINNEEMLPKIRQLRTQNKGVDAVNYIIALNLQNHFDTKELMKLFIAASKFKEAAQLAVPDVSLQKLFLDEMNRTRNGSKAVDFLKDFGKELSDFPELLETLQKAALRFHVHIDHWMKVEEKFCAQKHMLAYFIETLINEGKLDIALSIVQRNDLVNLGYIKNQHIKGILTRYFRPENPKTFNYLDNSLFTKDDYLPTEYILPNSQDTKFAEITDFNLDPSKDIIWVDNCEGEEFKEAEKEILGSDVVGIDTENRFNAIKLENWDTSVIQIATRNKIFIFDLLKIGKTPEYLGLQQALLENKEIVKLGHSLAGDLKRIREENTKPVLNNHVDLPKVYKVYNPKNKTSLASITEDLLNVPLSKIEQLSDWNRRPLRKAQIHYAALDAFILIILYEKLTNALTAQGVSMEKFKESTSNGGEDDLQIETKKVKVTSKEVSEIKPADS